MKNLAFFIWVTCGYLFCNSLLAQQNQSVITLETPDPTGTYDYVARDKVEYLPGYMYNSDVDNQMVGRIDPWITVPAEYSSLFDIESFEREIDESLSVGYTKGNHSVTPSGGAGYVIPLFSSEGFNGLHPDIGVSYSSRSTNGILGMGWNLSGLSMITRTGKSFYYDGEVGPITLTESDDRFVLDGQRLIKPNGDYGLPGEYNTELESFSRITAYGTGGWGPTNFKVETKEGLTIWYGESNNGDTSNQFKDENGDAILFWRAVKIEDSNGNCMNFQYDDSERSPRIRKILYSVNTNSGQEALKEMNFYYEIREDANNKYYGHSLIRSNHLLSRVESVVDGTVVKAYNFSYGLDCNSFLNEVVEEGLYGEQLNSTRFLYEKMEEPIQENEFTLPFSTSGFSANEMRTGDFNGDGRQDMMRINYSDITGLATSFDIYKNNGIELESMTNIGLSEASVFMGSGGVLGILDSQSANAVGDFDGDGKDEIMVVRLSSPEFSVVGQQLTNDFRITGFEFFDVEDGGFSSEFIPLETGNWDLLPSALGMSSFQFGDFDGDSHLDVMMFLKWGASGNSARKSFIYRPFFDEWKSIGNFLPPNINGTLAFGYSDINSIRTLDYNGDGRSDILVVKDDDVNPGSDIFSLDPASADLAQHQMMNLLSNSFPSQYDEIYLGDFNGDGKTDFLRSGNSGASWNVDYSSGAGLITETMPIYNSGNSKFYVFDVNKDGKSDVVTTKLLGNGYDTRINQYLSNGFSFVSLDHQNIEVANNNLRLTDFNNDGYLEFFSASSSAYIDTGDDYWCGYDPITLEDYYCDEFELVSGPTRLIKLIGGVNFGKLIQVKDGFNKETVFDYTWLSKRDNYTRHTDATYPLNDFGGSMEVVKTVSTSNGKGGTVSSNYFYFGAKIHREGRGFLGFEKTKVVNNQRENYTISEFSFTNPYFISTPVKIENYSPSDELQSASNYVNYELIDIGQGVIWPRVRELETANYLTGETSLVSTDYDSDGNIIRTETILGDGLETIITESTYTNCGTWIPTCPENVTTTSVRLGYDIPYVRTMDYEYFSNGNVRKTTTDLGTERAVIRDHTYTVEGFLETSSTSSSGLPDIEEAYEYDEFGHLTKKIFSNGDEELYSFDPFLGQMTSKTNSNGHTRTFHYDGFGKLIGTTDALGNSSTTTYNWDIRSTPDTDTYVGNSVFYVEVSKTGFPTERKLIDILGRERMVQTTGFNGQLINSVVTFDETGNILSETSPHFEGDGMSALVNTYSYDIETNRVDAITNSIGTQSFDYSLTAGLYTQTVTNLAGVSSSEISDASGRVVHKTDIGGTVDILYHSNGKIKSTSIDGVIMTDLEYDAWGNRNILNDNSGGQTSYLYDAYGQLVSQVNANGETTSYEYDDYGRIEVETSTEGIKSYEYTTVSNGKDQLKKVVGFNGMSVEYLYDEFGRIILETETIDGVDYETEISYDGFGRESSRTYPTGVITQSIYDSNGFLESVLMEGESYPIYAINSVNALGQVTNYTLGNNVTTDKGYNDYGMLRTIQSGGLQDLEYDYNIQTGNMNFRQDHLLNLEEVFEYDDLNRLLDAKIRTIGQTDGYLFIQEQSYLANGNIDTKSNVGDLLYEHPTKVHAISGTDNSEGNITHDQIIDYTSFNKALSIEEGLEHRLDITYGVFQNRKIVESNLNGEVEWSRIYGNQFEIVDNIGTLTTSEVTYLPGGACYVKTIDNTDQSVVEGLNYLYGDHQGSVVLVTDDDGAVIGRQNYGPWGLKRNPTTWDNSPNTEPIPSWTLRGYTGHEHYDSYGVVNMNGRIYDPLLGRMMQVDNYIHGQYGTQGYNRYSYALNNPLKYTDPDGEHPLIIAAFAVAGAYIGGSVANGGELNPGKWDWGSVDTYVGIIFGAGVGAGAGVGFSALGSGLASGFGSGAGGLASVFGSSGTVAAYTIAGGVTLGAGGYVIGAGTTLITGGNFKQAHNAGVFGLQVGFGIGTVVGSVYGIMNGYTPTRPAPPKPFRIEPELYVSLDDNPMLSQDVYIFEPGYSNFYVEEWTPVSGGEGLVVGYGKISITVGSGGPKALIGKELHSTYGFSKGYGLGSPGDLYSTLKGQIIFSKDHAGSSLLEIFGNTARIEVVSWGLFKKGAHLYAYGYGGDLMWHAWMSGQYQGASVSKDWYNIDWE